MYGLYVQKTRRNHCLNETRKYASWNGSIYLHSCEEDALVVLIIIAELAQRVHRFETILRKHVVKARNERSLTHTLSDVIDEVGRHRARQRREGARLEGRLQRHIKLQAAVRRYIMGFEFVIYITFFKHISYVPLFLAR